MTDHNLLNLFNELLKRKKMRGCEALRAFYLFFRNEFDQLNNTGA